MAILRTSWDETWHIVERAVERGKVRKTPEPTPRLGIDEKNAQGQLMQKNADGVAEILLEFGVEDAFENEP